MMNLAKISGSNHLSSVEPASIIGYELGAHASIERIDGARETKVTLWDRTDSSESSGIGDVVLAAFVVAGAIQENPSRDVILSVRPGLAEWAELLVGPARIEIDAIGDCGRIKWRGTPASFECLKCTRHERAGIAASTALAWPKFSYPELPWSFFHLPEFESPPVMICPQTTDPSREYSLLSWAKVCAMLKAARIPHFVSWNGECGQRAANVMRCRVVGGLKPNEFFSLVSKVGCLAGPDSGPAHIAGVLSRQFVALVSINNGEGVFGSYPTANVIQAVAPCSPCLRMLEPGGFQELCRTLCKALQAIAPEQVFGRIQSALQVGRG